MVEGFEFPRETEDLLKCNLERTFPTIQTWKTQVLDMRKLRTVQGEIWHP